MKARIKGSTEYKSYSVLSRPFGSQKAKMSPKKDKTNVRIEGNIENKSCSTTWVDPKTVIKPYPESSK